MIRLADRSDVAVIEAFDAFAGDRRQEVDDGRVLVWTIDSQAVGYLTIASAAFHQCPYVEFLCVHQAYRRRGIASALLSRMEANFRGRRLFISTEANNAAMLRLLKTRDYQHSGSLAGLNRDGVAEEFFFKDVPA